MADLREIVRYADSYLRITDISDWAEALNGLQIENSGRVTKIGAAVDASSATLQAASEQEIDFVIVHHGLFWPGLQAVTGSLRRQLQLAFAKDIALYSSHLPLDLHPEVGNNALLARSLGLSDLQPFLELKGQLAGMKASAEMRRDELIDRLEKAVGRPIKCIGAGPMETKTIGVVTGAAGSEIYAAAREVDTFITGEAPHWAAVAAEELGVNLLLGGHYATETFGVKALAKHLAAKFDLPWAFLDHPTGL